MIDPLMLRLSCSDGVLRIFAAGAIDSDGAHRLPKVVVGVLGRQRIESIELNLAEAHHIDDVGAAAILLCQREAARRHIGFSVTGAIPRVARTLRGHGAGHLLPPSISTLRPRPPYSHTSCMPITSAIPPNRTSPQGATLTQDLSMRLYSSKLGLYLMTRGRLDGSTAHLLGNAITLALRRLNTTRFIVDLSGIDVIDPAGVAALHSSQRQAESQGVIFRIAGPAPAVRETITACGHEHLLADIPPPGDAAPGRVHPAASWRRALRPGLSCMRPPQRPRRARRCG